MATMIQTLRFIKGPSPWNREQVCTLEIDPGLIQEPDPFRLSLLKEFELPLPNKSLARGFWVAELANQLQKFASCKGPTASCRDLPDGRQIIAFSYEEEEIANEALQDALWFAQLQDHPSCKNAREIPSSLRKLGHKIRLGPSTNSILQAALEQGIPVWKLSDCSLLQMGLGKNQQRVWTAETGHTPLLSENIAQDKEWTRQLLGQIGVPVPSGRVVTSREDAWEAAEYIGLPVVVKPQFGSQGNGVSTNLRTREEVMEAFDNANVLGYSVVTETFKEGEDYRILIIGNKLVAAAHREPAQVKGDGSSSIKQLVEKINQDPRRAESHAGVLSPIPLDSISLAVLASQGMQPESIPAPGQKVLIRRNANLSTGGTAKDVTDLVHPEVAKLAISACRQVGLDIAGVDIISLDISKPLSETGGAVVEINAGPGLRMHLEPSEGKGRPVGKAIINMLFPDATQAIVPMIAVISSSGETALGKHLVQKAGLNLGTTGTLQKDGLYLNHEKFSARSSHPGKDVLRILQHPDVACMVAEFSWNDFANFGLGLSNYHLVICADSPESGLFTKTEYLQELRHALGIGGKLLLPQELANIAPALPSFWAKTVLCCTNPWAQCLKYLALSPQGIIQVENSRIRLYRGEKLESELVAEGNNTRLPALDLAAESLLKMLPKQP